MRTPSCTARSSCMEEMAVPGEERALFAAASDHLFLDGGHALDFANKAFELLAHIGWEEAAPVLTSLVPGLASARRAEESSAWREPVDLVSLLKGAFDELPSLLAWAGKEAGSWMGREELARVVLAEDPRATVEALSQSLVRGASPEALAGAVAYAAARRVAQFHTANEFSDWDTVLHTFTYGNAVHQAMRRQPSPELLRAVFDGAISVYLNRFLNTPAAPLPPVEPVGPDPRPEDLLDLLDAQQRVEEAGARAFRFLRPPGRSEIAHSVGARPGKGGSKERALRPGPRGPLARGGEPKRLLSALGQGLLREDADFHTFQMVEGGFRQFEALGGGGAEGADEAASHVVVAVGRHLAAHCPTSRATGQTYQVALRLPGGRSSSGTLEGARRPLWEVARGGPCSVGPEGSSPPSAETGRGGPRRLHGNSSASLALGCPSAVQAPTWMCSSLARPSCGELAGEAQESRPKGYPVWISCSCGGVTDRRRD